MAALPNDIIIRAELRPCIVYGLHALFHEWTADGFGIVEFSDGTCSVVEAAKIQFSDNMASRYSWQE